MRELCTMCIEMHSHNRRCRSKRGASRASRLSLLIPLLFSIALFKLFLSLFSLLLSLSPSSTFLSSSLLFPTFPRFLGIHAKPRRKGLIGFRPSRHANDRIPFPWFGPADAMHLVARSSNESRITRPCMRPEDRVASKGSAQPLLRKLFLIEKVRGFVTVI